MDYKNFSKRLQNLIYSEEKIEEKKIKWFEIKKNVQSTKKHSRHISKLLDVLKFNYQSRILDHGCGSCSTLLYLLCLGYENIWGVDVSCDDKIINNFLNKVCNLNGDRIFNYDGKNLPFNNDQFDILVSQQVLEHIEYDKKDLTIIEHGRVLKKGAYAYYQIPHLLVPYEAHTKTWLIHWLPRKVTINILKIFKKNYKFYQKHLFLSLPFKYKNLIKKQIGSIQDLSQNRVSVFNNEFNELSGLSLIIRLIVAKICAIPYIGKLIMKILSNFIMIEILVIKND